MCIRDRFYGISTDIVPCSTGTSCVGLVIGTAEILNFLVDDIRMEPELAAAVGAIEQIAKHILFGIFLFRRSALGFRN